MGNVASSPDEFKKQIILWESKPDLFVKQRSDNPTWISTAFCYGIDLLSKETDNTFKIIILKYIDLILTGLPNNYEFCDEFIKFLKILKENTFLIPQCKSIFNKLQRNNEVFLILKNPTIYLDLWYIYKFSKNVGETSIFYDFLNQFDNNFLPYESCLKFLESSHNFLINTPPGAIIFYLRILNKCNRYPKKGDFTEIFNPICSLFMDCSIYSYIYNMALNSFNKWYHLQELNSNVEQQCKTTKSDILAGQIVLFYLSSPEIEPKLYLLYRKDLNMSNNTSNYIFEYLKSHVNLIDEFIINVLPYINYDANINALMGILTQFNKYCNEKILIRAIDQLFEKSDEEFAEHFKHDFLFLIAVFQNVDYQIALPHCAKYYRKIIQIQNTNEEISPMMESLLNGILVKTPPQYITDEILNNLDITEAKATIIEASYSNKALAESLVCEKYIKWCIDTENFNGIASLVSSQPRQLVDQTILEYGSNLSNASKDCLEKLSRGIGQNSISSENRPIKIGSLLTRLPELAYFNLYTRYVVGISGVSDDEFFTSMWVSRSDVEKALKNASLFVKLANYSVPTGKILVIDSNYCNNTVSIKLDELCEFMLCFDGMNQKPSAPLSKIPSKEEPVKMTEKTVTFMKIDDLDFTFRGGYIKCGVRLLLVGTNKWCKIRIENNQQSMTVYINGIELWNGRPHTSAVLTAPDLKKNEQFVFYITEPSKDLIKQVPVFEPKTLSYYIVPENLLLRILENVNDYEDNLEDILLSILGMFERGGIQCSLCDLIIYFKELIKRSKAEISHKLIEEIMKLVRDKSEVSELLDYQLFSERPTLMESMNNCSIIIECIRSLLLNQDESEEDYWFTKAAHFFLDMSEFLGSKDLYPSRMISEILDRFKNYYGLWIRTIATNNILFEDAGNNLERKLPDNFDLTNVIWLPNNWVLSFLLIFAKDSDNRKNISNAAAFNLIPFLMQYIRDTKLWSFLFSVVTDTEPKEKLIDYTGLTPVNYSMFGSLILLLCGLAHTEEDDLIYSVFTVFISVFTEVGSKEMNGLSIIIRCLLHLGTVEPIEEYLAAQSFGRNTEFTSIPINSRNEVCPPIPDHPMNKLFGDIYSMLPGGIIEKFDFDAMIESIKSEEEYSESIRKFNRIDYSEKTLNPTAVQFIQQIAPAAFIRSNISLESLSLFPLNVPFELHKKFHQTICLSCINLRDLSLKDIDFLRNMVGAGFWQDCPERLLRQIIRSKIPNHSMFRYSELLAMLVQLIEDYSDEPDDQTVITLLSNEVSINLKITMGAVLAHPTFKHRLTHEIEELAKRNGVTMNYSKERYEELIQSRNENVQKTYNLIHNKRIIVDGIPIYSLFITQAERYAGRVDYIMKRIHRKLFEARVISWSSETNLKSFRIMSKLSYNRDTNKNILCPPTSDSFPPVVIQMPMPVNVENKKQFKIDGIPRVEEHNPFNVFELPANIEVSFLSSIFRGLFLEFGTISKFIEVGGVNHCGPVVAAISEKGFYLIIGALSNNPSNINLSEPLNKELVLSAFCGLFGPVDDFLGHPVLKIDYQSIVRARILMDNTALELSTNSSCFIIDAGCNAFDDTYIGMWNKPYSVSSFVIESRLKESILSGSTVCRPGTFRPMYPKLIYLNEYFDMRPYMFITKETNYKTKVWVPDMLAITPLFGEAPMAILKRIFEFEQSASPLGHVKDICLSVTYERIEYSDIKLSTKGFYGEVVMPYTLYDYPAGVVDLISLVINNSVVYRADEEIKSLSKSNRAGVVFASTSKTILAIHMFTGYLIASYSTPEEIVRVLADDSLGILYVIHQKSVSVYTLDGCIICSTSFDEQAIAGCLAPIAKTSMVATAHKIGSNFMVKIWQILPYSEKIECIAATAIDIACVSLMTFEDGFITCSDGAISCHIEISFEKPLYTAVLTQEKIPMFVFDQQLVGDRFVEAVKEDESCIDFELSVLKSLNVDLAGVSIDLPKIEDAPLTKQILEALGADVSFI